ncbi:MAG: hypothetical protein JW821_02290 [Deltaproteobacteria bacterium]|nr:hypothetical protein [Deltaproteobacteria bacterium]
MGSPVVFLLRLVLAILLALLIGRIFFQGASIIKTAALAAALLGMAYLFEYTKKRDRGGGNES